jgi:lipopolysaccharide transport system permease protein
MRRDEWALTFELAKRQFSGRYRGSFGGLAWSFVQPLFLLAVYTLAFGVVFKTRWEATGTADYALVLFAGLIVFNAFSEVLNTAPGLIVAHPNYVKKVRFPLEILPCVTTLTALAHSVIGVVVWIVAHLLLIGPPHFSTLYFPFVLLAFSPVLLGIAWLLAALGVLVRDIAQLTGMLAQAMLFLTPVFYSLEIVPAAYREWFLANPLTYPVEQFRRVLISGVAPSWTGLVCYFAVACAFAFASRLLFRRLRPIFADIV